MLFNRIHQAAKFLKQVVPNRSQMDMLQCVHGIQKNDKLILEATDTENFLRITLPVWTDVQGEFLVDVRAFLNLHDKVASEITKETVKFGKVKLANQDLKAFPSMVTGFFKNPIWEISAANTRELVGLGRRLSRYTAGPRSYQEALEGICLRKGDLIATDGHRLLRCESSLKTSKTVECILPTAFFKLLANDFVIDDVVDISAYKRGNEGHSIVARGLSFELVCKLDDSDYPEIDRVLPKSFSHSFRADRFQMMDLVKEALAYAPSKNHRLNIVPENSMRKFKITTEDKDTHTEFCDFLPVKNGKNTRKWEGTSLDARQLHTILGDCVGRQVEIKTNSSPLSAVAFKSEDKHQLFVLMPLRKFEEEEPGEKTGAKEPAAAK